MKTKRTYPNAKTKKIIPLLHTLPNSMIARQVGCSREFVRQVREAHKINNPYKNYMCNSIWNEERLGKLIKLLGQNRNIASISRMFDVAPPSIYSICKRYNLPHSTYGPFNADKIKMLKTLASEGLSLKEIAEKMEQTVPSVYALLRRYNIYFKRSPKGKKKKV